MTTIRYKGLARPPNGYRTTSTSTTSGGRSFRCLVLSLVLYSALLTALLLVRSIQVADDGAALSLVAPSRSHEEAPEEVADGGEGGREPRRDIRHGEEEEASSLRRQVRAAAATDAAAKPTIEASNDAADGTAARARRPRPRTVYAPKSFPCAGIDLATYGIDDAAADNADAKTNKNDNDNDDNDKDNDDNASNHPGQPPYRLFDSFDLSPLLPPTGSGSEAAPLPSWSALLSLRRRQRHRALPFYADKVALRRYLPTAGVPVPAQYHARYQSELPQNDAFDPLGGEVGAVLEMIPRDASYVAKASHLTASDGVVLVRYVPPDDDEMTEQGRTFLGRSDANMREAEGGQDLPLQTARYLVKKFQERAKTDGGAAENANDHRHDDIDDDDHDSPPWALAQVAPGMIVEERITLWDNDKRPAMQFQCLVLWGRVFVARWNRGRSLWGLVARDGRVFAEWDGARADHPALPPWVEWGEVVRLAERVGAGKDMLRVDVFVGVAAADADARNLEALGTASDRARREAVQIVVADCELAPPALELGNDPAILEEAARLWIAGYAMGNYQVVPNTEVPAEFQTTGKLSAPKMSKTWRKTQFTLAEFPSMGVNLATYQMPPSETDDIGANEEDFELYDNFNIADKITGNENWWDLVAYRRELATPGLNFYVDKVAQRRWLPTVGMPIPRPFLCRYASELPVPSQNSGIPDERVTIKTMLPQESSYAAKPSHTSCSDGVWLVKHENGVTKISDRGHTMKEADDGALDKIAASLAKNLHEDPRELESVALKTVSHGFVVEERFTSIEGDDGPAMEFKIFCFWGRVWLANWRRGNIRYGLLNRNGEVIDWVKKKKKHTKLPDWVDWNRVIEIAEKMAKHKDAFRVDIFVGLPASSPVLNKEGASEEEKKAAVEIVISEFETHPTTRFVDPRLFDEAARLWIAGYKRLNYKVIPNDEIPTSFLEHSRFPAPAESREFVKTKHTTRNFSVAGVNLGPYRMNKDGGGKDKEDPSNEPPFELFEDFDISDKVTGNEAWWDMIAIRIGLDNRAALPFYNDKVALRRYLPSVGIPMPKAFAVKYKSELTETGNKSDERLAITKMLPEGDDFVAKPSHSCFGDDVWLVKHHMDGEQKVVSVNGGVGRQKLRPVEDFDRAEIGKALAQTLHLKPGTYGSWVYDNIKPGVVVEERFASLDDDNKPAVEFKVFTIWGKCYIAQWRRGVYSGIVYPDGSVVEWGKMKKSNTKLPDWVDWPKIKELAEKLGQNKDMIRTDIFVGVPSGSPALKDGASEEEKRSAVRVVVSEFEMQPGTLQMDPGIFDDAARLWLAGYKMGNYKVVPNTQVPAKYVEKGYFSEGDK